LEAAWDTKSSSFAFNTSFGVPLQLYFCPPADFGTRSVALTGPGAFVDALRVKAKGKGYRLEEDRLYREDEPVPVSADAALFEALDAAYLPPELRHRAEFVEAAFSAAPRSRDPRIENLVSSGDLAGDLHIHTSWSDGTAGIEAMVQSARALGYRCLAVTDHATEIKMIRSLTPERALSQLAEIEGLRSKYPDIRILAGAEVDILKDGRLYLEDDVLRKLDVVIASVHQDIGDSHGELVNRLSKEASNPHVDVVGHPTGRLIGRRPGIVAGLEPVFRAAAACGTALEINSSPERLDLPETLAAAALEAGVNFAISTDAHSPESLASIRYGVYASARRAGVPKSRVLNASPLVDTLINS
jgi:DNA polymerase (family 10)